jgi:hypothetical protein
MKKILRWIFFLPIGFAIAAILQAIPIFAYNFARSFGLFDIKITFWNVCLGIVFGVPIIILLLVFWIAGVLYTPFWSCGKIAPNNKVASVIFGPIFIFGQTFTFIGMAQKDYGFWSFAYGGLFSIVLFIGIITAYQKSDDK